MRTLLRKPFAFLIAAAVVAGFAVSSCSDDDSGDGNNADVMAKKAILADSINIAEDLLSSTEEGVQDGQYTNGSKDALQDAIDAAQGVYDNTASTATQVANATVSLHQAMDTYRGKVILPVAAEDLVGHWSFDEGTGTTAGDESGHNFNGTFKTGPVTKGAGFPEWAEDRYGNAKKAVHFNEGANIEVPYNTALNPKKLTIALWLNADEINAGNRFLGLHSWLGYKFQLQEANRPFMTVSTATDIYDRDSEQNLPINEWHHVAATFGDGNMIFYVDGVKIKEWNNTPGDAKSIAGEPYNLVIGQDFPTDKYAATDENYDEDHIIPVEWGGYFRGYLDEVRIYKTALSGPQIESIYNREKP
ncbi:LamG-like jellyroll fold domain-containing protein [Parachryseolinea silvisoli]|jgi:hypothetical protein|uniref:LamG-like jellyroll fold domain-containing protein n=1 Tax=Parachryseolinea silvisoli TaxID=2873601 RepID=UPI002265A475|nr:LamG-like jellyroll fold domain-containing protein [Parachryseolinea silvisoli]MCD9018959.1 hypothetical protein [Parachryseolinea silvisoli]